MRPSTFGNAICAFSDKAGASCPVDMLLSPALTITTPASVLAILIGTLLPVLVERYAHAECGSFSRLALDGNRTTVRFDNPFGDRQAQAGSALFPGSRFVRAPESVKDVWNFLARNSYSCVRHGNDRKSRARIQLHGYEPALRSVFHGVVDQDQQSSSQGAAVCFDRHARVRQAESEPQIVISRQFLSLL